MVVVVGGVIAFPVIRSTQDEGMKHRLSRGASKAA